MERLATVNEASLPKHLKSLLILASQECQIKGLYTVLCKRNANEIRCFSFFVLAKIRRNFATNFRQSAREFSLSQTKFRRYLGEISHQLKRNFVLPKFRDSENSLQRNFAIAKIRTGEIWP